MSALPQDLSERIQHEPNGCWRWLGSITTKGYGQVRGQQAHRVTYSLLVAPIPEGATLDHLCRNRWCVNPDHLEPVTNRENIMRGVVPSANRTRCKADQHDITTADAIYIDSDGTERCRECRRESKRRYRARLAA